MNDRSRRIPQASAREADRIKKYKRALVSSVVASGHDEENLKVFALKGHQLSEYLERHLKDGNRLLATRKIPGEQTVVGVLELKDPTRNPKSVFLSREARKRAARIAVKTGDASGVDIPQAVRSLAAEN